MTMSSPARARRPRLRRLATATVAAVATVALALAAPAGALAATGLDGPPAAEPITFTMAPFGNGVLGDAPLTVTVAAGNPTDSTVAAGAVRVTTSTTPLRTRADVQSWLAAPGDSAARTELAIADGEIAGIAAHGESVVAVPVDSTPLSGLAPGVYPLRADYSSGQGTRSAVSVLIVRGEAGSGGLGVVVPITAPPQTSGLLTSAQLLTLTAPGGSLRERLDAVSGTAAILAIDPAIVAAIRALGSSAPAVAVEWLEDLMALPNSRFALQFGDADLATQIAAGVETPLSVRTLAPALSAADFAGASGTSTPSPTPSPTSTAAAPGGNLPTLEALTDVGAALGTVYWPATGTAGSEVVAALGDDDVDDVASITLVDSGSLRTDTTVPAWATAGGSRVLVADADASSALRDAADSAGPIDRSRALAAASAYAALATTAAPDAPLLVTIDRPDASAPGIRAALLAADSLAGRSATDLGEITAGAAAEVALESITVAPERVAVLTTLLEGEVSLAAFASILADPAELTAPERAALLQLIGNGWRATPGPAADAVEAHRAQTAKTLDAVAIVPPSDITLAATSAPLGFSVRNDLPWPVSLVLIATPNDPRLIVQNTTPVAAGPSQNTRVNVPVEARVGSGESTLDLQLRSPSMVAVGGSVPVHVAVRAEWESVGVIVMITLVVGMIVLGAVRTVRKLRRGRGTASNGGSTDAADPSTERGADG